MTTGYYKDKICIVTGANSGIGYALSEELLNRGATVYMAGRDPAKIATAAGQLSAHGDRVRQIVLDVTNKEQVQKAIEGTAAEVGRLDMLFNNAGVGGTIPYDKATIDDWEKIIETNVWSVIYGMHAVVPIMLRQGSGHVVNTASISGLVPVPFQALYSLTKYGVVGLSECLRYEYAEKGLHFSVICPSSIATPIFSKGIDGASHGELKIPEGAIPADQAAIYMLDRVAEQKGIIIVPEEPHTSLWRRYVNGDPDMEVFALQMAHDRRVAYETRGTFY